MKVPQYSQLASVRTGRHWRRAMRKKVLSSTVPGGGEVEGGGGERQGGEQAQGGTLLPPPPPPSAPHRSRSPPRHPTPPSPRLTHAIPAHPHRKVRVAEGEHEQHKGDSVVDEDDLMRMGGWGRRGGDRGARRGGCFPAALPLCAHAQPPPPPPGSQPPTPPPPTHTHTRTRLGQGGDCLWLHRHPHKVGHNVGGEDQGNQRGVGLAHAPSHRQRPHHGQQQQVDLVMDCAQVDGRGVGGGGAWGGGERAARSGRRGGGRRDVE